MKKKLYSLLGLLLSLTGTFAQNGTNEMYVCLSSGEIAKYVVTDIDSVVYYNPKPGCPDENHPHMVDMGFLSGAKWACSNVGAAKPEEYGSYFYWGKTEQTDDGSWYDGTQFFRGNKDYDAATANWGDSWATPTDYEIQELLDNTTKELTTLNGVTGYKFTSTRKGYRDAYIFLPYAGYKSYSNVYQAGKFGSYWTSTPHDGKYAFHLYIYDEGQVRTNTLRYTGMTVRPVSKHNAPQYE